MFATSMFATHKYKLLFGIAALLVLLAGAALWQSRSRFTPPSLPVVNGYDDLLQAAEMLHPRTGFYDEMPAEELNEVVAHNRAALEIVRQALEKEIAVPVDWSRDPCRSRCRPRIS